MAQLYWPAVNVESVLRLASRLYPGAGSLGRGRQHDPMRSAAPVTYIPIPAGPAGRRGDGFAGLLTVDLPATVRYGNSFDIRVRRVTTRQVATPPTRPENQADIRSGGSRPRNPAIVALCHR